MEGYGLLQIGPSNQTKSITLLPYSSYAVSPTGEHFRIHSEPHPYDLEQHEWSALNPYVRDHINLIDKKGKLMKKNLKNGTWNFHFEFLTPHGKDTRDFSIKYWMFYYNPIIHGAPV